MAQGLAEAGAQGIAILDYQEALGLVAAERLKLDTGVKTMFIRVDVGDAQSVSDAVDATFAHFGKVDIALSSAGIADSNIPAEAYSDEMFRNLINNNLNGTFFICRQVGKRMLANKTRGSIINSASMSGTIVNYPNPQSCYNASKAAVVSVDQKSCCRMGAIRNPCQFHLTRIHGH